MKKGKVSNPHKSPAPPQLPKFVVAALFEIRYSMCSLLSWGVCEKLTLRPPTQPPARGEARRGNNYF